MYRYIQPFIERVSVSFHVPNLVGLFYWVLLNVHPCHRSTLRFIQLLAVAKSNHILSYGIDAILEPAINDIQTLANVSYLTAI